MRNKKISYVGTEVIVIVSEPWEFIWETDFNPVLKGKIIVDNSENTAVVVELRTPVYFLSKRFSKLICRTRHVGEKIDLSDSREDSNSCGMIGVPDEVFDHNLPFKYDTHTSAYMLGDLWTRKLALRYLANRSEN